MEDFLQFLRQDVTENLFDPPDYVPKMVDVVMARHDLEDLFQWAQVNSVAGSSHLTSNRQRVIEARMRVIIRRAHAKRNTIENRLKLDYPDNPKFGRF
ncbi:hypothetical protein [Shinella zoogloeoides]|uniref:hypothetical protein n=1 Tax=Shinella zoogloeoides TaxID=352475 RepID=UPI00273EB3CA|nr:hypothetical protein [Shinella zoogloeoides]WLR91030.1 hypothetical protein Q9316_00345 [Shinella zoogloeoides]